jgi:hypothetical protein
MVPGLNAGLRDRAHPLLHVAEGQMSRAALSRAAEAEAHLWARTA